MALLVMVWYLWTWAQRQPLCQPILYHLSFLLSVVFINCSRVDPNGCNCPMQAHACT
jgi:hypothetical protein